MNFSREIIHMTHLSRIQGRAYTRARARRSGMSCVSVCHDNDLKEVFHHTPKKRGVSWCVMGSAP
jgi:hypothetical protein